MKICALLAAVPLAACTALNFEFYTPEYLSGAGGSAGTGGVGGALLCTPGAVKACYDGPAGTEGQGICKAGIQTCAADGTSWEACVGAVLPQPENCATPEDEDCDGKAPACTGGLLWARGLGDNFSQWARSIAADSTGSVLVAGDFSGTLDFGDGPLKSSGGSVDVFIAKLDPSGGPVWSRQFGGLGARRTSALAVDASNNVLVAGSFTDSMDFDGGFLQSEGGADVFVAKLDASGTPVWSRRFGAAGDQYAASIAVDSSGDVLLTGSFTGSVDFGGATLESVGITDTYIAKLDAAGNHLWSTQLGGTGALADGRAVAVDGSGNVLLAATFIGTVDFGGGPLVSAGGQDIGLIRLDASGAHQWSKRFGDASDQQATSAVMDASGNILVAGSFAGAVTFGGDSTLMSAGGTDIFVTKLDANGEHLWSKRFGDASDQKAVSIALDAGGNIVLTGAAAGQVDFGAGPLAGFGGEDVFVVKLDPAGGYIWGKRFGDPADQVGTSIATDASGNVLVTGQLWGTMDFGGGPLTSAGSADVFIAKFSP